MTKSPSSFLSSPILIIAGLYLKQKNDKNVQKGKLKNKLGSPYDIELCHIRFLYFVILLHINVKFFSEWYDLFSYFDTRAFFPPVFLKFVLHLSSSLDKIISPTFVTSVSVPIITFSSITPTVSSLSDSIKEFMNTYGYSELWTVIWLPNPTGVEKVSVFILRCPSF